MRSSLQPPSRLRWLALACCGVVAFASLAGVARNVLWGADQAQTATSGKEQLAALQYLVGGWRGVGQIARGSTRGAWTEKADWAWSFGKNGSALIGKLAEGRYFQELRLIPGKKVGEFELIGITADDQELKYAGSTDEEGRLVLVASEPKDELPQRVTIRSTANGDRLLVLYERQSASGTWQRLGEVGSTRIGSGFGQGSSQKECVVTGGLGTMAVTFEGKTYYVCCTGCKELFDADPAQVLADYRERKEAEKAQREAEEKGTK